MERTGGIEEERRGTGEGVRVGRREGRCDPKGGLTIIILNVHSGDGDGNYSNGRDVRGQHGTE